MSLKAIVQHRYFEGGGFAVHDIPGDHRADWEAVVNHAQINGYYPPLMEVLQEQPAIAWRCAECHREVGINQDFAACRSADSDIGDSRADGSATASVDGGGDVSLTASKHRQSLA